MSILSYILYNPYEIGFTDTNWSIAGVGDFNNDGTDDVVLRLGDTDEVYAWVVEDGKYKDAIRLA